MRIIQELNEEDIYSLNKYLSNKNVKEKIYFVLMPALSILCGVLLLTKNLIPLAVIFFVFGLAFDFILVFLKKKSLKTKSIQASSQVKGKKIYVDFDNGGILYYFSTENVSDFKPIEWNSISRVVKNNNYFIVEIDYSTVLFIKPNNEEETEEFKKVAIEQLQLGIRYFED